MSTKEDTEIQAVCCPSCQATVIPLTFERKVIRYKIPDSLVKGDKVKVFYRINGGDRIEITDDYKITKSPKPGTELKATIILRLQDEIINPTQ